MSSSNSQVNSSNSGSISSSAKEDGGPLWNYVEKKEKTGTKGGNCVWVCNFCNETKQGTYTRVKGHLLKQSNKGVSACRKVDAAEKEKMEKLQNDYEQSLRDMAVKKVSYATGQSGPSQVSGASGFGLNAVKKRKADDPISKAFNMNARDELDCIIARMFYTGGLSFALAKNPYYLMAFAFAADNLLSGYVPPGYNKLRTTLLEQEKKHIDGLLQPIKGTWPAKGVTIVSDGWSDPQRRPLINFMVVCESGPMFIKAVNCAGEVKDKEFISKLMREVIDEIGHLNVVQVVTDNAANCKAAGEIIESIYPHIYWTPCVVHTLNLALKNICAPRNADSNREAYDACHWITEVHDEVLQIKNFIMNHGMRLSMYSRFTPLKLLSVADTRFASMIIMLKRFKLVKRALESMVVCDQWSSYRENEEDRAKFVRETILNEEWWDKVDYILAFTAPIYDMIRVCDTNKPCLHLVYEMWDSMIEKVKKVIYEHEHLRETQFSIFYDVIHTILVSRWAKSNTPLHCLAHSLNPRYYSQEWLGEDLARNPPHQDDEISIERKKCFKRLFPNEDDYDKVIDEYGDFTLEIGPFGDPDAIKKKYSMDPLKWWANFGASSPNLQKLALRVLGQPTSSSCCERNWSIYSFIHSLKRNKLNPQRAEDLVFIHNNLRLLSRNSEQYREGKSKMWDVGGDEFGSLEDTGVLEVANLSLDEPEIESVLFDIDA